MIACKPEAHCWHPTGEMLLSMPPYYVHQCCNCGDTKNERANPIPVKFGQHGPALNNGMYGGPHF